LIASNDWPVLRGLWQRCTTRQAGGGGPDLYREMRALYALGISLDDALAFLHHTSPSLDAFSAWLAQRQRISAPEPASPGQHALSPADLRFWEEYGYLVLRGAVPRQQCAAVQSAIWSYLDASPDDSASWYRPHRGKSGMMLKFSDHPTLEANRASARIRQAYEQLYGTDALFKTIDKVGFNPPETAHYRFAGSALHWDVSLRLPIPLQLQGLLYLGDCTERDGAFHCVPGLHRELGQWISKVPAGIHPREWALRDLAPSPVAGEAGDFIIWHQALPHCATPNRGQFPRMVQYLTYLPNAGASQSEWI